MQQMKASVPPTESATLGADQGAAAIEYGIMVALISAVLIATLAMTGNSLTALFAQVAAMLGGF